MENYFTIIISPNEPEVGGYWGYLAELPGVITQAETEEALLAAFPEALEDYLSMSREFLKEDEELKKKKRRRFAFRPLSQHETTTIS